MGEKVGKELVKREKGYLYYVGKDGRVYRTPTRGKKGKTEPVTKEAVKREKGYLYYLGKSGYVERVKVVKKK